MQLKTDKCYVRGNRAVNISESTQTDSVEFNLKKVEFYGIRLSFFARKEVNAVCVSVQDTIIQQLNC